MHFMFKPCEILSLSLASLILLVILYIFFYILSKILGNIYILYLQRERDYGKGSIKILCWESNIL